ncbi:MAG: hypothetical protein DRI79_03765 [Chloroflexi bacterium]|nr:MAG: hypothetical protein DRI79_03765 [Chloroflexota bacterium]HEY68772.1 histidine phosphatase family protein [Thermoflexia bacterium]
MTELIFIRHGQTHANVAGRWEGWSDSALTLLGLAQARAVACRLAPRTLAILLVVTTSVVQSEVRATEVAITTPISCGSSAVIPQMWGAPKFARLQSPSSRGC